MKIEIYEMTKEDLEKFGFNECEACCLSGADCFTGVDGSPECIATAHEAGFDSGRACFREANE